MKRDVSTSRASEDNTVASVVKARSEVSAAPVGRDDSAKGVGPEEFWKSLQVCGKQALTGGDHQQQEKKRSWKPAHQLRASRPFREWLRVGGTHGPPLSLNA